MRILALDAAFDVVSVAVWADGAVLAQDRAQAGRGQGELLMPMIKRTMNAAETGFAALDRIAVTIGPGHFTGLRLGLAAARGLGLAAAKPVDGVTTFDAVLASLPADERAAALTVVAFETKRSDLYIQITSPGGVPAQGPFAAEPAAAAACIPDAPLILLAGDGAPRLSAALGDRPVRISGGPGLPHAAWVAKLAADRAAAAGAGLTPPPEPLYLRPPDVTTPRARTQVWKKSSPACRPTSN
ncbi:MAG: tRNA (adenosine(37)-N6)-threonylcarbamoyltransferase complex dimerization subunit type 1 TsaB [Alphaproteobacteria bacterium]